MIRQVHLHLIGLVLALILVHATAAGVFGHRNTGAGYVAIDNNGDYYYEYGDYLNKCQMSDGQVLAYAKLDGGKEFTNIVVTPDGNLLFTLDSGIGIWKTETANFTEHSSLNINFNDGTSELVPRWDKILVFQTKQDTSLRSTTYEIIVGGRVNHLDDSVDDNFILMNGFYHGNNKTIDFPNYYRYNHGSNANLQDYFAMTSLMSETGFLALLEDTSDENNAVSMIKYTQGGMTTSDQYYEVNLMSFTRDFTTVNWINRYTDDYEAEALFYDDSLYLMLTLDQKLYLHILDPADGTLLADKVYEFSTLARFSIPQMMVSERYETLFLVYRVDKIDVADPTPANYQKMIISLFHTSNITLFDNFMLGSSATPYSVASLQISEEEQMFIKGELDVGTDAYVKKFTLSMYPLLNTQDFGSCNDTMTMTLSAITGSPTNVPTTVSEAVLTGLLDDVTASMRLDNSGITYVASPTALTPTDLCTTSSLDPKEVENKTIETYRTQSHTYVQVPNTVSDPAGTTIDFNVIEPSLYQVDVTIGTEYTTFDISSEYALNSSFSLQYTTSLSSHSGVTTNNEYTVGVACRIECTYCQNDNECIVCSSDYPEFCEHMDSEDQRFITAAGWTIKIIVFFIAFRSVRKLKIDAAFWWMVNMYQVLRLMTLVNSPIGLTLRNFLNDDLKDFMIQLNVNMLPRFLFYHDTTDKREYELYGFESNLFVLYFLTSFIVIVATAFGLTLFLAVLECLKKSSRRLRCMMAVAIYLSTNLWIRGIFEFSLTLFLVALLDLEAVNLTDSGFGGILSSASMMLFFLIIFFIVYKTIVFFTKNENPDAWPKGIRELYDPLKPNKMSIISFNMFFLVKRFILALIIIFGSEVDGTAQIILIIGVYFLSILFSILMIRFKTKMTTAIYYITEACCLACFGLRAMYDNIDGAKSTFGKDVTERNIDYTIIITILATSVSVLLLIICESFIACKEVSQKRKEKYQTQVKQPKYEPKAQDDENKWKEGTVQKIRAAIADSNKEAHGIEFDNIENVRRIESDVSHQTISHMGSRFEDEKEEIDLNKNPKGPVNLPSASNLMKIHKIKADGRKKIIQNDDTGTIELARENPDF